MNKVIIYLLLVIGLCASGCENVLQIPEAHQPFHFTNETRETLVVRLDVASNGISETREIEFEAGENGSLYVATVTSGVANLPSAHFSNITVLKKGDTSPIYSGVIDDDWSLESLPVSGNKVYRLTIYF